MQKLMNIFILEDDILQQEYLEKLVKQLTEKNNISYKLLYVTARPEYLMERVNIASNHQLYFLDIEIKNHPQKGLEVAQNIRKRDPYGTIVFVTTHSELAPKTFAYKVAAVDFIEKDQDEEDFKKRIEECLIIADEYEKRPVHMDTFSFENAYTSFQVPFTDILYFETAKIPHKIKLVTTVKTIEFYGNLSEIAECDKRLLRCHKSYVANVENGSALDRKKRLLFFQNDIACPISRRMMKETVGRLKELGK